MTKMHVKVIVYKLPPQPNPLDEACRPHWKTPATTSLPLSTRRPQVSHRHEDEDDPIIVQCPVI